MGRALWRYILRLYKERRTGHRLFQEDEFELIDIELEKTLTRLRGEQLDDAWLNQILTSIEHPLVTPQCLRQPEIRDWLADNQVRHDLKALARAKLLGGSTSHGNVEERLIQAYARISAKPTAFAMEATNVIVMILVTGYRASLDGQTTPLAGLIQAAATENRDGLEELSQEISGVGNKLDRIGPDELVVRAHTEQASEELSRIIKRRGFLTDRARDEIRVLIQKISSGDLRHANQTLRAKALYWAARLHAPEAKHLSYAKRCLDQLHKLDTGYDTRIIDALVLEQEGNVDGALRLLRDIDTDDGRSTLWLILSRTQSKQAALSWFETRAGHTDSDFFTGIGWQNLAVALAEMGMWEKAAEILTAAERHTSDWPELSFVEGVINAAMLLPIEMRLLALRMNIFHAQVQAVRGPDAYQRRMRAYACFNRAVQDMTDIGEVKQAQIAKNLILWLRLTDEKPEIRQLAQNEVREAMANGRKAIDYLRIAIAFAIEFEKGPLQQYLMERKQMGGLEGQEVVAEVLLAETTMTAREYAEFLERDEIRLAIEVPKATLAGKRIEALLKDGQVARARHVLEKHKSDFVDNDYDRLRAMILKQEGRDVRTTLEENYARTGDLLDLQNLAQEIEECRDWSALRPLLEMLFQRERTTANAYRLVECMRRDPNSGHASVASFFNDNPDITDWSDDLKSEKAWADLHVGQLKEARLINDQLLENRNHPVDLQLDMNLAIQLGDWERFPAIVDREWRKRNDYNADVLLRLASLAAEVDPSANRAFELAKLAASKAPNDPAVLMNAYSLTFQLGRDQDADPSWMARAVELSSDTGPVRRIDLRKLVREMMPANRERHQLVERHLLRGEVPLHMAAEFLNRPLSRTLIDLPRRNEEQSDGRRRVIIPVSSGGRQSVGLQPNSSLGLDITSLMVLGYLGLLRTTINAFDQIFLAPDTMVVLLDERRRVRFHQPSRIKFAEDIRDLIDQGRLKPTKSLQDPPTWLVEEVGRDLAEMLEVARTANGRVVHPRPIRRITTFFEGEADLRDYDNLIVSTTALARLLFEAGKLAREKHEQGVKYLAAHDKGDNLDTEMTSSILTGPLYLDDLAVTYFQQAGLLQSVCRSGIELVVHESMREEQDSLIAASREGERLNKEINEVRSALREGIDNGRVIFLPRYDLEDERIGRLAGFLSDSGSSDYVCIDDRFMNRHAFLTDKRGRNVPVVCTQDIIKFLAERGFIDAQRFQAIVHRLRAGGFGLVPVDADELERLLRNASIDTNNQLIESLELKVLRQSLMRIRGTDMLQHPSETPYLLGMRLACILTIHRLWQDVSLPTEHAVVYTDWIWRNIAPSPFDWGRTTSPIAEAATTQGEFVKHLAALLSPMGRVNGKRYKAFLDWVEQGVLEPLLLVNNCLIDDLAQQIKAEIGYLVERLIDEN